MTRDFLISGTIVSPLVPQLLLAVLLTGVLTIVLMRLNFYRLIWHRPLVELAMFCMILATIVVLMPLADSPIGAAPRPTRIVR